VRSLIRRVARCTAGRTRLRQRNVTASISCRRLTAKREPPMEKEGRRRDRGRRSATVATSLRFEGNFGGPIHERRTVEQMSTGGFKKRVRPINEFRGTTIRRKEDRTQKKTKEEKDLTGCRDSPGCLVGSRERYGHRDVRKGKGDWKSSSYISSTFDRTTKGKGNTAGLTWKKTQPSPDESSSDECSSMPALRWQGSRLASGLLVEGKKRRRSCAFSRLEGEGQPSSQDESSSRARQGDPGPSRPWKEGKENRQ